MFDVYDLDCDGHIQYAELDKIIRVNNFFKTITNCVLYHDHPLQKISKEAHDHERPLCDGYSIVSKIENLPSEGQDFLTKSSL